MTARLSVAVIGAGIGGLATAAALRRAGADVTVYEQARRFNRVGAGIQVACNAMHVLRGLGLEERMRRAAFYPRSWNNRDWRTGEVRYDQIFGRAAEEKYGAPYLLAHRGDLHAALASAVPGEHIRLGHQLAGLDEKDGSVVLGFADGTTAVHDAVVAADGVHSLVKGLLFGADDAVFTGRIAHRTTFPPACSAATGSTTAPSGGVKTATSSSTTLSPTAARPTWSAASQNPVSPWNRGRRRATWARSARHSTGFTPRSSTSWRPVLTCTNGLWWTATHSTSGMTATSPCSAMPAIP